jgi:ABC-type glycerol-3-phosphate transport system substrate-binding protein
MKEQSMKTKLLIAVLAVTALAAACGGSDFVSVPPPTSQVPASASQSINGWIAYLKALVATPTATADVLEPVDTSTVTPPSDETSEPQPVD